MKLVSQTRLVWSILGQKPRRTKAPKDRSPAIFVARTEAPRLKNIYFKHLTKMNALFSKFNVGL